MASILEQLRARSAAKQATTVNPQQSVNVVNSQPQAQITSVGSAQPKTKVVPPSSFVGPVKNQQKPQNKTETFFQKADRIVNAPLRFLGTQAEQALSGPSERLGSIFRSIQSKSLEPIKEEARKVNESFKTTAPSRPMTNDEYNNLKQVIYNNAQPMNDRVAEAASNYSKMTNIALMANVDAGLSTKGKSSFSSIESKKNYQDLVRNPSGEVQGPKVNVYKPNEPGAYPKSLRQAESIPMTPTEKVGIQTRPVLETNQQLQLNPQAGFINPEEIAKDVKNKVNTAKEKAIDTSKYLRTELVDRYAPLQDLVEGKKLGAESDPYIAARNYAGHVGKIENRLNDLGDILTPHRDILPEVKQYALLDRYQELAGRGITKFPDNLTPQKIVEQKAALEAKLGPEGMAQVNSALEGIRGYNDRLLTEAKDAGIISQESFDAIKKNNQKYIPLQRIEYLAEQGDSLPKGSNSFNVATQKIIKPIKGSEKAVADPLESIVRNTYNTVGLIERNKVAQKVAALADLPAFKGVVEKVDGAVPAGMEKLSVFKNGIKEEYAVPKDIAQALKGMNVKEADLITSWIGRKSASALRAGATTYNPTFFLSNAIRDYQTARIASPVKFNIVDWLGGFSEAIKKGDLYKQFLESGGSSGYFQLEKDLPKTVNNLTASRGSKVIKTITNPIELLKLPGKLISGAGELTELAPRLAVFKSSLKEGLPEAQAAFNARNATVDFSRAGNTMRLINQWVPFLNARLQGTLNAATGLGKGFRNKPLATAWKLTTLVGLPVVATYLNNTQRFPEIWDDISNSDKRDNFILIFGDKKDDKGNPTQVVKIPKGEIKTISNPLESFLDYLSGKDPKSLNRLAVEVLGDASPVGFEKNGKPSLGAFESSVLPPVVKGLEEYRSNKNLYTGYDIVPQSMVDASPKNQYDEKTSLLAKELGKALNWSPKKIDNFISTQFGGVGRQVTNPGTIGEQIKGRFMGARGSQQEQNLAEEAQKAVQIQADKKLEIKRRAQQLLNSFESESPEQAAKDFESIAQTDPAMAKTIADLKEKKDLKFTDKDYIISDLGVENGERAKFLKYQFDKLDSDGKKAALWDDLVNKKLITEEVAQQMSRLLQ